jgi:hypothetical protein
MRGVKLTRKVISIVMCPAFGSALIACGSSSTVRPVPEQPVVIAPKNIIFFLLDPQILKTMKLSKQVSNSNGAVWYEREQGGVFQKVLWNEQMQIPLVIESGDRAGSFYRRVEVKPSPNLQSNLPWLNLKGFVNREYADYLD